MKHLIQRTMYRWKGACVLLSAILSLPSNSSGQDSFVNLDFEMAQVVSNDPTFGFLDWNLAVPGWTGDNMSIVYHGYPHAGETGWFMLYDSVSPAYAPGTHLAGNYSLGFANGLSSSNDEDAHWLQSYLSQTGIIPGASKSVRLLAVGEFEVLVGGVSIQMQGLGGNLYGGDISGFAGNLAEIRIVNTATTSHPTLVVDNISFSVEPVETPVVKLPPNAGSLAVTVVPTDGTISTYLISPPVGTLVYSYEPGCWGYVANQFGSDGWKNPIQPIRAGQGLLTWSPSDVVVDVPSSGTLATTRAHTIYSEFNLLGLLDGESLPIASGFDEASYWRVLGGNDGWSFREHNYGFGFITDESTLFEHATNGLAYLYREESSTRPIADCDSDSAGTAPLVLPNEFFPKVASPVRITSVITGEPIGGTNWKAQMYYSWPMNGGFEPFGPVMGIGTGPDAGYVTVDELVPAWIPGTGLGDDVHLELRVWDGEWAATYDEARLSLGVTVGRSEAHLFTTAPSSNFFPPTPINVRAFQVTLDESLTPRFEFWDSLQDVFVGAGGVVHLMSSVSSYASTFDVFLQSRNAEDEWTTVSNTDWIPGYPVMFTLEDVNKATAGDYRIAVTANFATGESETFYTNVAKIQVAERPTLSLVRNSQTPGNFSLRVDCDSEFPCVVDILKDFGEWEELMIIPKGLSSAQIDLDLDQSKSVVFIRAKSVLPIQ